MPGNINHSWDIVAVDNMPTKLDIFYVISLLS